MRNKILEITGFRLQYTFLTYVMCVVLCLGLALTACTKTSKKGNKPVAKVGDKYLYFSQMDHIFPKGSTPEDSLSLAKLYIDNWIKTQLLLRKAELNLTEDQSDISEELETYRTSLLIYKYEEQLLGNKLDTAVSKTEIQNYYEANTANFLLDEYAVKALYLKIPVDAPNIKDVKRWYVSDREKDIQDLTHYCYNYANKFDFFNDDWVLWSEIEKVLPQKEAATKLVAQSNKIEQEDNGFIYLVYIKEKRGTGEVTPLNIIKDKVKNIIINKRKLNFISELEYNIYNDALVKKQFEIYKIN